MTIRAKISALTLTLVAAVLAGVAAAVLVLEGAQVRAHDLARADALAEGVRRIAQEAGAGEDEIMLLSYLKFLLQDYPEIEWARVERPGHVSELGQGRPGLYLRAASAGTYSVTLGFSPEASKARVGRARWALLKRILAVAAAGLAAGGLGAWWLGGLLAGPVDALSCAARDFGTGKLDAAVPVRGKDELAGLAAEFNAMAARIRELVRLKEELFGALSHELSAPLTGLKGFVETLLDRPGRADEEREALETMAGAAGQMEVSLANAMALFRREGQRPMEPEVLSAKDLLSRSLALFAPLAKTGGVRLEGPEGAVGRLVGDRELLRQAFVNLVSNAVKYSPQGGAVRILIAEDASSVSVSVSDDGPGVAPEDRERIFTKLYRAPGPDGRPQRIPGSGLGLAIAKSAVDRHGGRIWVEGEPGRGSTFRVRLPKVKEGV